MQKTLAQTITKIIEWFYPSMIRMYISRQTFRYAACGALNMVLDLCYYFVIYNYLFRQEVVDLGWVAISPHIASLIVVFPITLFNGFWLNRNVAFVATNTPQRQQIWRYLLSVGGSLAINYILLKLFVEYMGIWATPAKLLTTIITVIYSYLAARFFTFRQWQQK